MQTAAALTDAPIPLRDFADPYGQLIKMLLPRAHAIAIYDRLGVALWASDGFDDPTCTVCCRTRWRRSLRTRHRSRTVSS